MNDIEYLKKYYQGNIKEALKELESGKPVQYIVGNVNFYGLEFNVNENVLIPRFETEELIYKTFSYLNNDELNILDIGTGSGCIAITLKHKLPKSKVTGVDISESALEVANSNKKLNKLDVNFLKSDIFSNVKGTYDLIISNPPYIDPDIKADDLVHNNEPHSALYASDKGLYFYKKILKEASSYINEGGIIAFEIGYNQGKDIKTEALKYFPNAKVYIEKDLQEKDRFVFIINE